MKQNEDEEEGLAHLSHLEKPVVLAELQKHIDDDNDDTALPDEKSNFPRTSSCS